MSIFRKEYRELSDDEKAIVSNLKEKADDLYGALINTPDTRERLRAIENLEQAVMWAVKGITG